MNKIRKSIQESLLGIQKYYLENLENNESFWVALEGKIYILQEIAIKNLDKEDDLLFEIEKTRKIIQTRNIDKINHEDY